MAKKKITKTTKNKMTKKTKKAIAKKKIPSATKVLAERLVLALIVILILFLVYELFMMINPGDLGDLTGKPIGVLCDVAPCTGGLFCDATTTTCQECTTDLECGAGFQCIETEGIVGGQNNICLSADNILSCEVNDEPIGFGVTLVDESNFDLASYCLDDTAYDLTSCVVGEGVIYDTMDCPDPLFCYKGVCDMFINGLPSNECDPACVAPEVCFQGSCINNNVDPNDGPVIPDGECDPACVAPEVCFEGNCIDGGVFNLCDPECGAEETCQNGVCVPTCNDPGFDDVVCGEDKYCDINGFCVEEFVTGQVCSDYFQCQSGVCTGIPDGEPGICVECTNEDANCEENQACVNNECVDVDVSGMQIGESEEFELTDGSCLMVTLDNIDDQLLIGDTSDDTYDFSVSECQQEMEIMLERIDDVTETTVFTADYGLALNIGDIVMDGVILGETEIDFPIQEPEMLTILESIHYIWLSIPGDVFSTIDFEAEDGFDHSQYALNLLNWPMNVKDEELESGEVIHVTPDLGGNNYGIVQGVPILEPTELLVGKVFEFNGENSITAELDYDFTTPFSVEFFFKRVLHTDMPLFVLELGEEKGMMLSLSLNNELVFSENLMGDEISETVVGSILFVNDWNHVTMVYDGSVMIFYLNGQRIDTESDVTMVDELNDEYVLPLDPDAELNQLSVGYNWLDDSYFEGFMDEFKIYQRAISEEQIQLNFDSVLEITTTDGVQSISVEDDASYYSFNKISVVENSGCGYWAVTAIAVDIDGEPMAAEDGNDMVFGVLAPVNSDFGDEVVEGYCGALTCVEGLCDTPVNCVDDSNCVDANCVIEYELVDEVEKECTVIDDCTFLSGYECGTDGKCFKGTCVPSDPPTPDDVTPETQYSPGGGSPGSSNNCPVQDSEECHAQKAYTPCVGGQIMYTCMSTCGTSLLFVYDCEGNTPSFAPGCNNKIKDIGEDGVDCGGSCSAKCPDHCFNSIKDNDETGVDCGGKKCKTCEKPAPVITPKQKTTPDPVVQKPSGLSKYWWTIIPFLVIIGLIVFLVVKGKKPVGSVEETMEVKETTSTPKLPKMTKEEKSLHNDHMKTFVKKELGAGKSKSEISKSLEKVGHKPDDINNVFETGEALPKGYEEQLRKYVTYYLDQGKSPAEIRKTLGKQGWSKKIIDMFLVE